MELTGSENLSQFTQPSSTSLSSKTFIIVRVTTSFFKGQQVHASVGTSVILAPGKRGSRRHFTTSSCENVVVAPTGPQKRR